MTIKLFRTKAILSALVAATASAALAGCSSDTAPPQQTPPPAPEAHHGGYAGCLAEHGVPTPPPGPGRPPVGVDQATWDSAVQACASLAPGPG